MALALKLKGYNRLYYSKTYGWAATGYGWNKDIATYKTRGGAERCIAKHIEMGVWLADTVEIVEAPVE